MSNFCVECGEPLEDDDVAPDGKRHVTCVCACTLNKCPRRYDVNEFVFNAGKDPCKGQCGCLCCHRRYQDFLSME